MEHFLINSSVCLFVLWLAYKLLLESSSWHSFKKWYLLGSLILSSIIPLIVVKTVVVPIQEMPFVTVYDDHFTPEVTSAIQNVTQEPDFTVNWLYLGLTIYLIGVAVMLWRFGRNLYTFKIGKEDIVRFYKTYQLILRNQFTIPHSFIKRIFVSKEDYETNQIPEVILEHEKAHLDQKHSIDILFIELLLIVFWFNPLLYVIKYSTKLNHEFLADQTVLNQGISTSVYQKLILKQATTGYQKTLANTFTFPIIKKRFHIMKTKTSQTSLLLRSLVLIPIIAVLIVSCGKEKEIRKIDHSAEAAFPDDVNMVYAVDINGHVPEGTTIYNGIEYKYKINDDYTANLYYPDGAEVDVEANQLYLMIQYDAKKEVEQLKQNEQDSRQKIDSGKLKIIEITSNKNGAENRELTYDQVVAYDFSGESFSKSKEENSTVYSFHIFPDLENILEIPSNEQSGVIQIFGKPYGFEKINDSIVIKNKDGKVLDWKKAGFKIKATDSKNNTNDTSYISEENEENTNLNEKITNSNHTQKNVILNSPRITTGALNKTKDITFNSNFYAEVAKEPDTEDFKFRKMILIASLSQNKPIVYQLNGKKSTVTTIQEYLVNHETANVAFIEGNQNELQFSKNNGTPMNKEGLQKVYSKIFKYRPKEEPTTFVAINETSWKVVTVDATVSKGAFERKGADYTYDSSDLNNIKVFNDQGKLLNKQEFENLATGFSVIWWKGEEKYKELLQQPEIIAGLKNRTYAVFYRVGNKSEYTKDYQEALKIDASNSFLRMGSTLESTTINLTPHSWAYTNPSLTMFQKYLTD